MSGTSAEPPSPYDVAIVGGGVVGCAIARELAGAGASVVLIEQRNDVGDGTSKANTAILHTGFDATPGTLEAQLVARGYELLGRYAEATGIPVERTGAVLVAWTDEELAALPGLQAKAVANGYDACELIGTEEVRALVPKLGAGVLGGLTVPGESIICPWTTTLALATDAQRRGAVLRLGSTLRAIHPQSSAPGQGPNPEPSPRDLTTLDTSTGRVRVRWVINAAGLGADEVDKMAGFDRFTVTPRRGELLVFDKLTRPWVPLIVLPVPSSVGKGVLISPTIYGNVMLGPTAEDLDDKSATGTSEAGLDALVTKGRRLMPELLDQEVTAAYAGLRAAVDHPDFLIEVDPSRRYVLVGGIRSTGLTSAMAIAEHVRELLEGTGFAPSGTARGHGPSSNAAPPPPPRMPNLGEDGTRPYQDPALIAADPAYGRIVCFCERVTEGEIRDALAAEIPARDLDGLRRRTRALNGRCQGFFCGAQVRAMLAEGRQP